MSGCSLNFQDIQGFNNLSSLAKKIFISVYQKHNLSVGIAYKKEWKPIKVKEHKDFLEVHFINGEWLHYTPKGDWY